MGFVRVIPRKIIDTITSLTIQDVVTIDADHACDANADLGMRHDAREQECTRFGIECKNPPERPPYDSSGGQLEMCVSAPNPGNSGPGRLFDISRYIDFFDRPSSQGGVKFDPAEVLLVAIDAPETPFEVVLATGDSGQDGMPYVQCPFLDEQNYPYCLPTLQHSCSNPTKTGFFGDPSVRINAVVRSAQNHSLASICDNDYTAALTNVGKLIISQLSDCCLPARLPDSAVMASGVVADCTVEDVTQNADGSTTSTAVPRCTTPPVETPCWRVEKKATCAGISPQTLGLTVERAGQMPPRHTTARATCRAAK